MACQCILFKSNHTHGLYRKVYFNVQLQIKHFPKLLGPLPYIHVAKSLQTMFVKGTCSTSGPVKFAIASLAMEVGLQLWSKWPKIKIFHLPLQPADAAWTPRPVTSRRGCSWFQTRARWSCAPPPADCLCCPTARRTWRDTPDIKAVDWRRQVATDNNLIPVLRFLIFADVIRSRWSDFRLSERTHGVAGKPQDANRGGRLTGVEWLIADRRTNGQTEGKQPVFIGLSQEGGACRRINRHWCNVCDVSEIEQLSRRVLPVQTLKVDAGWTIKPVNKQQQQQSQQSCACEPHCRRLEGHWRHHRGANRGIRTVWWGAASEKYETFSK